MSKLLSNGILLSPIVLIININYIIVKYKNNILNKQYNFKNIYIYKYNNYLYLYPYKLLNLKSLYGTIYSLIVNIIKGCIYTYNIKLSIIGIGYKVILINNYLIFSLGLSHQLKLIIPDIIKVSLTSDGKIISLTSIDNIVLGNYIGTINRFKKFNLYKGKGITIIYPYKPSIQLKKINKK